MGQLFPVIYGYETGERAWVDMIAEMAQRVSDSQADKARQKARLTDEEWRRVKAELKSAASETIGRQDTLHLKSLLSFRAGSSQAFVVKSSSNLRLSVLNSCLAKVASDHCVLPGRIQLLVFARLQTTFHLRWCKLEPGHSRPGVFCFTSQREAFGMHLEFLRQSLRSIAATAVFVSYTIVLAVYGLSSVDAESNLAQLLIASAAILLLSEKRMSVSKLAREEGLNPTTVWRWATRGVRGVKLETMNIGARRFTSREAFERFVAATTAVANGEQIQPRNTRQREKDIDRAEAELDDELGIGPDRYTPDRGKAVNTSRKQ